MAPNSKGHRWYLGGVASAGAACVTHPLDLLKVSSPMIMWEQLQICTTQAFIVYIKFV